MAYLSTQYKGDAHVVFAANCYTHLIAYTEHNNLYITLFSL